MSTHVCPHCGHKYRGLVDSCPKCRESVAGEEVASKKKSRKKTKSEKQSAGLSRLLFFSSIGVGVLLLLFIGFVAYLFLPAAPLSIREASPVDWFEAVNSRAFIHNRSEGAAILIRVRMSRKFLSTKGTQRSDKSSLVKKEDFSLVSPAGKQSPIGILDSIATQGNRLDVGNDADSFVTVLPPGVGNKLVGAYTAANLPEPKGPTGLDAVTIKMSGFLDRSEKFGRRTMSGALTATLSGGVSGVLKLTPVQLSKGPELTLSGELEAVRPDGAKVKYRYSGSRCSLSWDGSWQVFSLSRTDHISPPPRLIDSVEEFALLFERPSSLDGLSLQFRDSTKAALTIRAGP